MTEDEYSWICEDCTLLIEYTSRDALLEHMKEKNHFTGKRIRMKVQSDAK